MMKQGFTLAELLIALAILGVIATFTIPKVLQSQQSSKDKSATKEAVAMVSGAFQAYTFNNKITANTWFYDFTPYMNYVADDTQSVLDDDPTGTTRNCSSFPCLKLHSGATLQHDSDRYGGTSASNALYFMIDPDGKSGSANKSIYFLIYANGKIRTWGTMDDPTVTMFNTYHPNAADDPPWFSWN